MKKAFAVAVLAGSILAGGSVALAGVGSSYQTGPSFYTVSVENSNTNTATAICSSGDRVVGGGGYDSGENFAFESRPTTTNTADDSWTFSTGSSELTVDAYAICVH